ncbi:MAG: DUF3644 domain-containing protein [Pseudomonadota bacterium]
MPSSRKDERQKKFFHFLQKKQKDSKLFSKQDVIAATGWTNSTFNTYLNKHQISQFLVEVSPNQFEAINTNDISFIEFKKKLSQSKHYQELGHRCKSNLAKALLKKSKDNMMLALELYNRPSLENKLDGFVMLFCTAWEQLLKAKLIERDGEDKVYEKTNGKKGLKKTISLRTCLDRLLDDKNNIRKNIEIIADWRDEAVHLLMPEIQAIASRVFQSGVLNFSSEFEKFTEVPFISPQHTGMLSLVGDFQLPPASLLKSLYGSAAEQILELANSVEREIESANDIDFAIPINVSLMYTKDENGAQVILAKANGKKEDIENLKNVLMVEKAVDPEKTHPLTRKTLLANVLERLNKFENEKLRRCLVARENGKPILNTNCIDSCVHKLKWQSHDNAFHHHQKISGRHLYSMRAVEELVRRITENESFVKEAKHKFNKRVKKQKDNS